MKIFKISLFLLISLAVNLNHGMTNSNSKITSVLPTINDVNRIISSYLNEWELIKTLTGHTKEVTCILFSKDGKVLISGSEDGNLKFWDVDANSKFYGTCIKNIDCKQPISSICYTPCSKYLTYSTKGQPIQHNHFNYNNAGSITTLNINTKDKEFGNCIKEINFTDTSVMAISYSLDGKYLFSTGVLYENAYQQTSLRVFSTNSYDNFKTLDFLSSCYSIIFLPNNNDFIKTANSYIQICKIDDGSCIKALEGHRRPIKNIKLSPNGKRLASVAGDGYLKIWDIDINSQTYGNCILSKGEYIDVFDGDSLQTPRSIEYYINNQYLAVGYRNGSIKIMECQTGNWLQTLTYNKENVSNSNNSRNFCRDVTSLSFSPCNSYLIAGYKDGAIKIWKNQANEFLSQ